MGDLSPVGISSQGPDALLDRGVGSDGQDSSLALGCHPAPGLPDVDGRHQREGRELKYNRAPIKVGKSLGPGSMALDPKAGLALNMVNQAFSLDWPKSQSKSWCFAIEGLEVGSVSLLGLGLNKASSFYFHS